MATKFQAVFNASTLDTQGCDLDFCHRQRLITPARFGLSVVASMATEPVRSIADLHRHFNALWNLDVSYRAFYDQAAQPSCGTFLLARLCDMMDKLSLKVLGVQNGRALSACGRMLMQDGSSFAIHDALRQVFPGRFNAVKPAAVELHCTLDLLRGAPLCIVLSPDTVCEQDDLPEPERLKGDGLLADRGDLNLAY
jgi:hypothetical protein